MTLLSYRTLPARPTYGLRRTLRGETGPVSVSDSLSPKIENPHAGSDFSEVIIIHPIFIIVHASQKLFKVRARNPFFMPRNGQKPGVVLRVTLGPLGWAT